MARKSRTRAACLCHEDTPGWAMMFQTPEGRVLFLPFATWAHKNVALCLTPIW